MTQRPSAPAAVSSARHELDALFRLLSDQESNGDGTFTEIDFDQVRAWTISIGTPENEDLAPVVRERLLEAVQAGKSYDRDVFAEILARILGAAALPDLVRAANTDLGDDRDAFNAVVWDVLDQFPEPSRGFLTTAASTPSLLHSAAYFLTFLPPRADGSLEVLLTALSDPDDEARRQIAYCVRGSSWSRSATTRERVEPLLGP